MSNLQQHRERIYKRHVEALHAVTAGSTWIDAGAAHMALYLALDELAQMAPDAPTQDAEGQLVQLNDWLAENAPKHFATVGNTAETVIALLDDMDNTVTLREAEFNRLATEHKQIATRLQAADTDVARLTDEVAHKSLRIADLMAALEEANSRPHALKVVAATPLPDVVHVPANGHDYAHMTTAQIVQTLALSTPRTTTEGKRGTYFHGTNEQLLEAVKTVVLGLHDKLGRAPSKTEFNGVCSEHNIPTVDALVSRLGMKWSEIIAHCGLEAQKSFGQAERKERAPGAYYRYTGTDAELEAATIAHIKQLAAKLGHAPSRIDFDTKRPDGLPTIDGISRRLKVRWMDLVSQAGLTPLVTTAKGGASESGARFPQGS